MMLSVRKWVVVLPVVFAGSASAQVPYYAISWASAEAAPVPVLSTPLLAALALLVAAVALGLLKRRSNAARMTAMCVAAGTVLMLGTVGSVPEVSAIPGGAIFPQEPEQVTATSCVGSESVASTDRNSCGVLFLNKCGGPVIITYSDVVEDTCGQLDYVSDNGPGTVVPNGESVYTAACTMACKPRPFPG